MQPFHTHTGIAAPLLMENVDTDLIIPKEFLKTLQRTGLGRHAFHDLRYDGSGAERADFVLNRSPGREATILLGGANFGCGSSREHAPWALLDFGFRVILAPSFADIFYNNCCQNGILPGIVTRDTLHALASIEDSITVDLEAEQILASEAKFSFTIPPHRRRALLLGQDEIGRSLACLPAIKAFEATRDQALPWLNGIVGLPAPGVVKTEDNSGKFKTVLDKIAR